MKKRIQFGMALGLFVLAGVADGQNIDSRVGGREKSGTETHLSFILKLVDTNFNYGKSNSELADYKQAVSSLQTGLSFQGGITKRLSLVSELYLMMKGGRLKSGNPMTESSSTLRLYSLEMPALVRVHFNRFHINAGPSVAYNLTGRQNIGETKHHVSFKNEVGGFKRWEGGVQFGGGYRFPVKGKTVMIDLRYHYGLTNISHEREIRNRYVNVSLQISRPWKNNPLARK